MLPPKRVNRRLSSSAARRGLRGCSQDETCSPHATTTRLLLTDAEQLFVFGDNTYGQLGTGERGASSSQAMPVRLALGGSVLQVAAGCVHSLALVQGGGVFSWGYGNVGQLGHDDFLTHSSPRQVPGQP